MDTAMHTPLLPSLAPGYFALDPAFWIPLGDLLTNEPQEIAVRLEDDREDRPLPCHLA